MTEFDFDTYLKTYYPTLEDPIYTAEDEYRVMCELKEKESDEFDAEYYETITSFLLHNKILRYVSTAVNKAINRENLGKEAYFADALKIDAKHKVTSLKIYSFLRSLDKDSISAIIGGVTDSQEEFDDLSYAIDLDDKDLFVSTVCKYNNIKLHNICAHRIALQNDMAAYNCMIVSDPIHSSVSNREEFESNIEDCIDEKLSYSKDVIEEIIDVNIETLIQTYLQMGNIVFSVRERKQMKQFFEDPIVKRLFDGGKYISETKPQIIDCDFVRDNPISSVVMPHFFKSEVATIINNPKESVSKQELQKFEDVIIVDSQENKDRLLCKIRDYIKANQTTRKGKTAFCGVNEAILVYALIQMKHISIPPPARTIHDQLVQFCNGIEGVQVGEHRGFAEIYKQKEVYYRDQELTTSQKAFKRKYGIEIDCAISSLFNKE